MAIAPDSFSGGNSNSTTALTFAHTTNGLDRVLVLWLYSSNAPTGVTYGGEAMAFGASSTNLVNFRRYQLVNPPLGTNNIVVSFAGASQVVVVAGSWTGVKQTGFPHVENNTGLVGSVTSSSTSLTTTQPGCWMVGWCGLNTSSANQPTAGADTTRRFQQSLAAGIDLGIFDSNGPITPAGAKTLNFATSAPHNHFTMSLAFEPSPELPPTDNDSTNKYLMTMKMQ